MLTTARLSKVSSIIMVSSIIGMLFCHCYYLLINFIDKENLMTESSHGSSLAERYLYHEDWPASKINSADKYVNDYQLPTSKVNQEE